MSEVFGDILVRIRGRSPSGAYATEMELRDGSRPGGEMRLEPRALLAQELDATRYGSTLFDALFAGDLRSAFDGQAAEANRMAGGRFRVRLWIDQSAGELQGVAWERMSHLVGEQWLPIAIHAETPFSRYMGLNIVEPEPIPTRPIRLLFAVSNPIGLPADLAPVDVEGEVERLHQVVGDLRRTNQVDVTVLPGRTGISAGVRSSLEAEGYEFEDGPTSFDNLIRLAPRHQVLHYLGHGGFRRDEDRGEGRTWLHLEAEDGSWEGVPDDDFLTKLVGTDSLPSLVFLAACQTAPRAADAAHPFVGLGPKLVRAGVPAVVAMQDVLPMRVAGDLTRDFYRNLLEHGLVDLAMNQARLILFDRQEGDWAVPVLFTRLRDGRLFVPGDLANRVVTERGVLELTEHGALVQKAKAEEPVPRPRPVRLLPRDFAGLLGREAEVQATASAVASGAPVEFFGAAGFGKTSLLRHLACHPPAGLEEGVIHHTAADMPVEDLLQFLFQTLYSTEAAYKPSEADLRRHLQDARVLYVLDDVELSRQQLQGLVNSVPESGFLLASEQQTLWEGRAVPLRGIPDDAGVALFERELGRPLSDSERDQAAALCRAVQGQPLRIVQAAAAVRDDGRSVDAVVATATAAPTEGLTREVVPTLSNEEQQVLGVLSALPGGRIGPEHVEAVTGLSDVEPILEGLRSRGLAKTASPQFAAAEAAPPDLAGQLQSEEWAERILLHFLSWTESHREEPGRILEEIDAILASLAWARSHGAWGKFLELARAAEGALIVGRRWGTWRELLEQELEAARAIDHSAAEAWALHQLGTRGIGEQTKRSARRHLKRALKLRKRLGDHAGAGVTRHNLRLLPIALLPPVLVVTLVLALGAAAIPVFLGGQVSERILAITPGAVAFSDTEVGRSAVESVEVRNPGDRDLQVGPVRVDPPLPDYVVTSSCGRTLPAGASCLIEVRFEPTTAGPLTADLLIGPEGGLTQRVHLTGTGISLELPAVALDPPAIEFGPQAVGTRNTQSVTVSNGGTGGLAIDRVTIDAPSSIHLRGDGCSGQVLRGDSSCRLDVLFFPEEPRDARAVILLHDNAEGSPHQIPVTGTGVVPLANLQVTDFVAGQATFEEDGLHVPVTATLFNSGNVPAGVFKIGTEKGLSESDRSFARFVADDSEDVVPDDPYAFTERELAEGAGILLTGEVIIPTEFVPDAPEFLLFMTADSCLGDEIFTGFCRVQEIDEFDNDASATVQLSGGVD